MRRQGEKYKHVLRNRKRTRKIRLDFSRGYKEVPFWPFAAKHVVESFHQLCQLMW